MKTDSRGDLLIELGTEELPPLALRGLMDAFAEGILGGLAQAGVAHGVHRAFATPRRLAVLVREVALRQPDRPLERRGPALAAAFDADGNPTRAAEGFARACGVAVADLTHIDTDKGAWLAYRGVEPGRDTAELVPAILEQTLARLPTPRRMRWGDSEAEFVRPVHWLVALLGDAVIPARALGVASGAETRGHRFHHPEPIPISVPAGYETLLRETGHVLADHDARRERIRGQVQARAEELGGRAVIEPGLLEEVTALVEWPVALAGGFDTDFLRVPAEALISSMQGHQKYFPVRDMEGRLLARFITVANLESRDPALMVAGNERVIRPRLADAAFFWDRDRRTPLAERVAALRGVVFQQRLGSLYDKSARVVALGGGLAERFDADPRHLERAAWLSRADLVTEMVGEFPELQGIMGRYYASHDGEAPEVAAALQEYYRPRFAGDTVPTGRLGQLLGVADRADTLIGIFAAGGAPTGAKDPFALRRSALGLVRICIEAELAVDLRALFESAAAGLPADVDGAGQVDAVIGFCLERLRAHYQEQGVATELFEAVRGLGELGTPVEDPLDFHRRLTACRRFVGLPEAAALAAANKRIRNILRQAGAPVDPDAVDSAALAASEERTLHAAIVALEADVDALVTKAAYTDALLRLAGLREPVDRFFDAVLVMAEDAAIRCNRLALLTRLQRLFLRIADVSRLPGPVDP